MPIKKENKARYPSNWKQIREAILIRAGNKCEFCGRPCTRVIFAAFACDREECINAAREARGGPGGHKARKMAGRPIVPKDTAAENAGQSSPVCDLRND